MQSFIVIVSLVSELTGEVKMALLQKTQSLVLTGGCRCEVVKKLLSTTKK